MSFLKYPKLRRPSHSSTDGLFQDNADRLCITEKFDGNNYRLTRDGTDLRFGSRNVDLGTDRDEIGGQFADVTDYLLDAIRPGDLAALEENVRDVAVLGDGVAVDVVLFGENAVQHTIDDYQWDDIPQFQLFDVWVEWSDPDTGDRVDGTWLPWIQESEPLTVRYVADLLGIHTVPMVSLTTVGEFRDNGGLEAYEVPASTYRPGDKPAEGVVFRNLDTGVRAKYLSDEFVEMKQDLTGSNTDSGGPETDHDAFCDAHVTNRRIKKNIQKLLTQPDSGYDELSMALMEDLHRRVWHDVWAEDYEEIIATDWILDMDQLHNDTASRCASYLQRLCNADDTPVVAVDPGTGDELATDTDEAEAN